MASKLPKNAYLVEDNSKTKKDARRFKGILGNASLKVFMI